MIPLTSHISRAIRAALWCYDTGKNWAQARNFIAERYSSPLSGDGFPAPSLAAPNHGFIIIGWLYSSNFEDRILKAVNCGLDTDCTGATLAALLGIIEGADALPARWVKPVGDKIILYERTRRFNHPKTVAELTDRTEAIAAKIIPAHSDTVGFGHKTIRPKNPSDLLARNEKARETVNRYDLHSAEETDAGLDIIFHYDREPVLYPNTEMAIRISLRQNGKSVEDAKIELAGPRSWTIVEKGSGTFGIRAKAVPASEYLTVKVKHHDRMHAARFVLLSPDQITGFCWEVKRCSACNARKGACLCRKP